MRSRFPGPTELLCLFGADPNLLDIGANTRGLPLKTRLPFHVLRATHLALAKAGRDTVKKQIVEYLILASACLQVHNLQGMSALHLACSNGCIKCAGTLVALVALGLASVEG